MSSKFELYSSTFLYSVETEQAVAVSQAESMNDNLALEFYNKLMRHDAVSDCPHWCEFSPSFEVSVYGTHLETPDCLEEISKIIDAHVAKCIEIVNA